MAVTNWSRQLGCGRDIDAVWTGIHRPPDTHEADCLDCQAARASLAELAVATEELTALDEAELTATPALVDRILDVARSEIRRGRRLPLVRPYVPDPGLADQQLDEPRVEGPQLEDAQLEDARLDDPGELTVAEQAVGALVRQTGDRLPGIQVRRCSVKPTTVDAPVGLVGGGPDEPAEVLIEVRVSVDGLSPIIELTEDLRQRVIATVQSEAGLVVGRVDVIVEDIDG